MMVGELMRLKHWWNDMNRKTKVLEQKCDTLHHKSYMDWLENKPHCNERLSVVCILYSIYYWFLVVHLKYSLIYIIGDLENYL